MRAASFAVRIAVCIFVFVHGLPGQTPGHVDFEHDILPVLRQNCIGCHGPKQQNAGLRLDRRSSVIKDGIRRLVPGSAGTSMIYHRLIGNVYGTQMPPSGPLKAEQINLVKAWIDQGAEWPDALANEADLPPINQNAVALVERLQKGDLAGFMKSVSQNPRLLNERGPEGSTPFMYAVLYTNAATLKRLLKIGADPNRANDGNATALMWAASDLEKTRLLLEAGANPNVRSYELRTPLMIAARRHGNLQTVKLLLDHKANPNPNANPGAESSPLFEATTGGDPETMALLLDHGADVKAAAEPMLAMAITLQCAKCVDLLVARGLDQATYTGALQDTAILGDVKSARMLLDHGADVNAADSFGRTPLMYAVGSDVLPIEEVKLLIERGANVNAINGHNDASDSGVSVLGIARWHGDTPIVDLLVKAGAKATPSASRNLQSRSGNTIRTAIEGSIPLIQRADANFVPKAGCVACHNNSLAAMTVSLARKTGFRVDEKIAGQQVRANAGFVAKNRDRMHQGFLISAGDTFGSDLIAYVLIGLHGEHYPPDIDTDAAAMFIRMQQRPDGHWASNRTDTRPPLGSDYVGQTALSMHALQLYAPQVDRPGYEKSVKLASAWLTELKPLDNDDRCWKLLGLAWGHANGEVIKRSMQDLLATQRSDGGWSDLPSMRSSAYATGRALFALGTAGLPASDAAYKRGVEYLLSTQQEDGSWFVKTRALAFQPYFDAGFSHGHDQFISAAGSSWATMALVLAAQEPGVAIASRSR
jgi:ankyrin repeat protein